MMNEQTSSLKKNMLFNTVGSLLYYACQWFLSVIIVRISGYRDAGILSIAMSVTASPAIIGLFNIRSYQVSDITERFSDEAYIRSRTYTNILSFIVCGAIILINGYTWEKVIVILAFMLFKISEGYADVYYGIEQKRGRLDVAGISLSLRGAGVLVLFVAVFLLTKSMLLAILVMTVFSFAVLFLWDMRIIKKWDKDSVEQDKKVELKEISGLLITCLPLAVVAFLNNLSVNIPKIFLERYYGSEAMGYYSSVASPTIVIQLAATTVFAPLIPILTEQYHSGEKKKFINTVKKFAILVTGLSAVCLVLSKLLAHWGLVLLFTESIEPYVYLFIPVVWVSIFIAINACLFSVCTLLRIVKLQYVIGGAGVALSWLLSIFVVKNQGMVGVVWALIGSLTVQIIIQVALIVNKVRRI